MVNFILLIVVRLFGMLLIPFPAMMMMIPSKKKRKFVLANKILNCINLFQNNYGRVVGFRTVSCLFMKISNNFHKTIKSQS